MDPEGEGIVRDASSLHKLVESTCEALTEQEISHLGPAVDFLRFVRKLKKATQDYLCEFALKAKDPTWLKYRRATLVSIRIFWEHLHRFIKPVVDAHCLNVPVPLLRVIEEQLGCVSGLKNPRFVTLHTNSLNYTQFRLPGFRSQAADVKGILEKIISNAPEFPKELGLIAIPYSQARTLFYNLLICHEVGHFVFEELAYSQKLNKLIEQEMGPGMAVPSASEASDFEARTLLARWCEEIFCDRFAVHLIGPAYSFAYVELFDLGGQAETREVKEFTSTHPADACRLREQKDALLELGWLETLQRSGADYWKVMDQMSEYSPDQYSYDYRGSRLAQTLFDTCHPVFIRLLPKVKDLVRGAFQKSPANYSKKLRADLDLTRKYLSHGVVPSALISASGAKPRVPEWVAIINAASLFHATSLRPLVNQVKEKKGTKAVESRSSWTQRVESWALKALEDYSLLRRARRG